LIESRFQVDLEKRISIKQSNINDQLVNRFKLLNMKNAGNFIPIREIITVWEEETPYHSLIRNYYKPWLYFRNWLAHGCYLQFNNLNKYDYPAARNLAQLLFSTIPFEM